jgi:signal transduction histidine kinase
VPLLVAALMVAVAAVIGQGVLHRLARDQERHLAELSAAYLDGLATALQPAAVRRDVWEAFDALDRARGRYAALRPGHALLALPDGTVLAASEPRRFPVGNALPAPLAARAAEAAHRGAPVLDESRARATLGRDLLEGDIKVGRIVAEVDIAPLLAERAEVRNTLLMANGVLTLVFAALGFWLVRRLLRPLEMLRAQAAAGGETGRIRPLPARAIAGVGPEFAALFRAWNRTAAAVDEREAMATRLAEEERYAQLGKLASGMAHEVNNPLAGLLTAVDTLATHGDDPRVRETSVGFLRRGLDDIRNVVRASLVTYKGRPGDGPLRRGDLDDLRLLVRHEVDRRGLRLAWDNALPEESGADRT